MSYCFANALQYNYIVYNYKLYKCIRLVLRVHSGRMTVTDN